jgi:tetratricopeptide (TPR) repeat protein
MQLKWIAPTVTFRLALVASAIVGAVCCFVPLFNVVGYESAALFGVLGGLAAPFLTLHSVRAQLVPRPGSSTRVVSPTADFFRIYGRLVFVLLPPFLLLSLNAFRVQNCAWGVGMAFWLAIPVVSIFIGQAIAWVAVALAPFRPGAQISLILLAILGSVGWVLFQLAFEPPIVGHHIFLGYFSGSIYDEALNVPMSLVWYRLMGLALSVAAIGCVEMWSQRRNPERFRWALVGTVLFAAVFAAFWLHRQDLGIHRDAAYIQDELGGRIETEHFIIYYPANEELLRQRSLLAEDHEYRYDEMQAFFETDPAADGKLVSYIYPNKEVKADLMGGRRTQVAKLWLQEIHLTWPRYGDHMLAHEMAHLFTEPFGAGPLKLSMTERFGVNMGLVEGIAAAADWPARELTPHRASAALIEMDAAPDIEGIVAATGFWAQSSGKAYTLVGSLVRYLVDTYGIDAFKQAYPRGDFEGAYGKPPSELIEEWKAYLAEIELTERERALARFYYDRPSIFQKVCPRRIAELRRQAQNAASAGRVSRATELYETIIDFEPDMIRYRIEYARALEDARQYDKALNAAQRTLERASAPVEQAQAMHLLGDLYWRSSATEKAVDTYESCLDLGVPAGTQRLLSVKRRVLRQGEPHEVELAAEYLLGETTGALSLYVPVEWVMADPMDPLANYLVARRLWSGRQWQRSLRHLETSAHWLSDGVLLDETTLMMGQSRYFVGDYPRAVAYFKRLESSSRARYNTAAAEWLRRIQWKRRNSSAGP